MSAIVPYVVNDETPENLKTLIIRFPFAMGVFRNIALGESPTKGVYFDAPEMLAPNDPIVGFVIEELCKYKLLKRSGSGFDNNYSEIFLVNNSFTPEQNQQYTANLLKQMSAVVLEAGGAVKNFHLTGTLSDGHLASMVETVSSGMSAVRDLPDGDKRFIATFVIKQF